MKKDYGIVEADPPQNQDEGQFQGPAAPQDLVPLPGASEMEVQMAIAKKNPRDLRHAMAEALSMVSDPGIAEKCWYTLERWDRKEKKKVALSGPSVRLSEIVAYAWRNIGVAGNIVEVGATEVVVEGLAIDLERNNRVRVSERRSIVGHNGRYSQDMIEVTAKAAQAIAMRNAVFKIIPKTFVERILDQARKVAAASPFEQRVTAMLQWAKENRITEKELLKYVGLHSLDEIDEGALSRLRGAASAIKEGVAGATVHSVFKEPVAEQAKEEADELTRTAPRKAQPKAQAEPPQPADEGSAMQKERTSAPSSIQLETQRSFAKEKLGPKLFQAAWDAIAEAAAKDEEPEDFVRLVCLAPKSIIEAAANDQDRVAAMNSIVETVRNR